MKAKILNLFLIITSLVGYLEWSGNNSSFLFQSEYDVLTKIFINPKPVVHPFIFIPIAGQILLLITLIQKKPSKMLTYIGIACLALLLGFMFFIGITSLNIKILASTLPFLATAVYTIIILKKQL